MAKDVVVFTGGMSGIGAAAARCLSEKGWTAVVLDRAAGDGINLPVDAGWLVGVSWATYGGFRNELDGGLDERPSFD